MELVAVRLIGEICDSHALLLSGWGRIEALRGNGQIPALVEFIENKLVVKEYILFKGDKTEDAKLKKGDIITHIEGKPVEAIVDSIKKYYPASNDAAKLRDIARDILRSNKQYLHISYISLGKAGQKEIDVVYRRALVYNLYGQRQQDAIRSYRFIGEDIGYINLRTIKSEDITVIKKEFMNVKGIIIDLRTYPPSYVAYMLGSFFVSENTAIAKETVINPNNPGEFVFGSKDILSKLGNSYPGKLVVIVNENTQSQAEFTAMTFRAGANTTIIGGQTAGADGDVSEIVLLGGLKTWISGVSVYYPDGRKTQRVGVVPDIEVKPTIQGIREGCDESFEKAIEIIRQE